MKIRSLLVIGILMVALASVAPVKAHFTLGNLIPSFRFHSDDFDPHLAGPTAYVWPGGGLSSYTGFGDGFPLGYQSPYPGGNPPGQSQDVYQLEGDAYSPFGAVLASMADYKSRGPLLFALNFSEPCQFGWNDVDSTCGSGSGARYSENFTGLNIYIPPEFDLSALFSGPYSYNPGLIESTFGATAADITIARASATDPWGPGWWVVSILGDIHWWPQHDYREWYYVRINDVIAPKVAGRYFFKMFLQDQFFNFNYPGMPRGPQASSNECGTCNQGTSSNPSYAIIPYSGPTNATIPVENWPVMLVEGDLNPAIMTGTIRYGTFNQTLYGRPIDLPGRVKAIGTAINPFDPDHSATGKTVEADGYFNATAQGHFEVEGVAPGIYDIYASAAGYPNQLIATKVAVLPSQSLHLDGYIDPGIIVKGTVYSRSNYGEANWPAAPRPVYIEIYDNSNYSTSNLAAFSPLNFTDQPYMAYDWDYFSSHPNIPIPRPVAFPWFSSFSYYSTPFPSPSANPNYNSHSPILCGGKVDACGKPNGVGPAQYWWVDSQGAFTNGGGTDGFAFQLGVKGLFGTPTNFDGHIPQSYASWTSGLGVGHYWVRAWINGYTQTSLDGRTVDQASFTISKHDWDGDISVPVYLRVSGSLNVTIHFQDQENSLVDCPIDGCPGNLATGLSKGNRYLIAEVRDTAGTLVGINFTEVFSNQTSATIEVNGFGLIGPDTLGMKYSYLIYQGHRDYGISTGTYHLYLYMRGYLQSKPDSASIASGSVQITSIMHRGARLNMTLYSVDWEKPKIQRPWEFPGARLRVYVLYKDTQLSEGYIGYPFASAAGGDREVEPIMQPACYNPSTTPPYCPTGSPQVIDPNDPYGSTIIVNEWDGYAQTDIDGPGIFPSLLNGVLYAQTYYPGWNLGGFLEVPSDYRLDAANNFTSSEALPTGVYSAYAFTYGYLQTGDSSLYATEGGVGDMRMDLLKGINITLYIPMTNEGLLTPTQFNMSMRVRVFDGAGNLVATAATKGPDSAISRSDYDSADFFGLGRFIGSNRIPIASIYETYYPDPFTASPSPGNNPQHTGSIMTVNETRSADTFLWYGSWRIGQHGESITGWQAFDSDPDHDGASDFGTFQTNSNFLGLNEWRTSIPYHTEIVRVALAGIYDVFGDPLDGQNSGILSSPPWNKGTGEEMNSMQYGIYGSTTGPNKLDSSFTVEVDCWNEYPAPSFPKGMAPPQTNWYPPVQGLLQGDSFHTVSNDPYLPFGFTGDTLSSNGLGPYFQGQTWKLSTAPVGGEASSIFKLDKRGYIEGSILGFTVDNQLRSISWAGVEADTKNYNVTQYSWDGYYEMYLDPGSYNISVGTAAYSNIKTNASIAPGQSSMGFDFQLELNHSLVQDSSSLHTSLPMIVTLGYKERLETSLESVKKKRNRF
jgi:hypothetical protein